MFCTIAERDKKGRGGGGRQTNRDGQKDTLRASDRHRKTENCRHILRFTQAETEAGQAGRYRHEEVGSYRIHTGGVGREEYMYITDV